MNWTDKCWGKTRLSKKSINMLTYELLLVEKTYCSIHYHNNRVNRFILKSGNVSVVTFINGSYNITELNVDKPFEVDQKVKHMFVVVNSGYMIEEYFNRTGDLVEEEDIVRICVGGVNEFSDVVSLVRHLMRSVYA